MLLKCQEPIEISHRYVQLNKYIWYEFPEYTNTLMFLPKVLLSKRMLDNSTKVSGANWNLPDMLNQMNIFVEFPEYTNQYTLFLPKILLSKRMLQFSQSITSQLKFSQI